VGFLASILDGLKKDEYTEEVDRFKAAIRKNPGDLRLRAQYAKLCLRHYLGKALEPEPVEAVGQIENLDHSDLFDPEFYYLIGRYYQGSGNRKAKGYYLEGVKRYNQYVVKNPHLKLDYLETTLASALNLMTLQTGVVDPELSKFFKCIHRSYPLHIKRVELESVIEKPESDPDCIRQLRQEVEQLKPTLKTEKAKGRSKD